VEGVAGSAAVFVGGKDDEASAGGEVGAGETPLVWVGRVVGEGPVEKIDGVGGEIGDFDPVGMFPVFIDKAAEVAGEELGDDDRGAEGRDGVETEEEEGDEEARAGEAFARPENPANSAATGGAGRSDQNHYFSI
jgi:hypothetical protein